ncbi:Oxygen regulatory protein NreC [compost metagenome]
MKHMIRTTPPLTVPGPAAAPPPFTAAKSTLTPREQQVLYLIAKGHSNRDIAEVLSISVKTVEAFKSKIMNKLHLYTRPALVDYAEKAGYFLK